MMLIGADEFIAGNVIAKLDAIGKPCIAEKLKSAVNSGLANTRIPLRDILIEFLQGMMAGKVKKRFRNQLALICDVQAVVSHELHKLVKRIAGGFFHFLGGLMAFAGKMVGVQENFSIEV